MYKMVCIMRTDLGMGKGKMVAQGGHAWLGSLERANPEMVKKWKTEDMYRKVTLKIDSLDETLKIETACKEAGIPCYLVHDAGLTQIEPGSITCLGIGPDTDEKIDKLTGHLKLL